MTTLTELRDLLDAATGPSRELDGDIIAALKMEPDRAKEGQHWERGGFGSADWHLVGRLGASTKTWHAPKLTASIDTALALVERLLPGWRAVLETFGKVKVQSFCTLKHVDVWGSHFGAAPTAPLAILRALVAALIDQGGGHAAASTYAKHFNKENSK
jgi:hypothetical protein